MKTFKPAMGLWIVLAVTGGDFSFAQSPGGCPTPTPTPTATPVPTPTPIPCATEGTKPTISGQVCCTGLALETHEGVTACESQDVEDPNAPEPTPDPADSSTTTDGTDPSPSGTPVQYRLAIQCLKEDGTVAGITAGQKVCTAILPKCSDVRTSLEKNLREYLSMKIWGYYNRMDVDPNKSKVNALVPVEGAKPITSGVCSVVGHTLKYTNTLWDIRHYPEKFPDFEISKRGPNGWEAKQVYGLSSRDCGKRPRTVGAFDFRTGSSRIVLKFSEDEGKLWNSYLMGVYPWLIRRKAADVLSELRPDFSNYDAVVKTTVITDEAKAHLLETQKIVTDSYTGFSEEQKAMCEKKDEDLLTRCKENKIGLTEPGNRLCTLSKAYTMYQKGSVPNFLMAEVMARVDKDFGAIYADVFDPAVNGNFKKFRTNCETGYDGDKKYANAASCLHEGVNYYRWDDGHVSPSDGSGKKKRRGTLASWTHLKATPQFTRKHYHLSEVWRPEQDYITLNRGFAGFVEWIIRTKVCGQYKLSDVSVCDTVNIPTDPTKLPGWATPTPAPTAAPTATAAPNYTPYPNGSPNGPRDELQAY